MWITNEICRCWATTVQCSHTIQLKWNPDPVQDTKMQILLPYLRESAVISYPVWDCTEHYHIQNIVTWYIVTLQEIIQDRALKVDNTAVSDQATVRITTRAWLLYIQTTKTALTYGQEQPIPKSLLLRSVCARQHVILCERDFKCAAIHSWWRAASKSGTSIKKGMSPESQK